MISPGRLAAYRALRAVDEGRQDLPAALGDTRNALTDERDRALATEIATGTLRWRAELDYLIVHYSERTIDRLDPEVLDVLRLGAYQLVHLDRVPPAAAIGEAVELVRHVRKHSAAGFVNAVLRAVSRGRRALPLPKRPTTATTRVEVLDYLATTLSHPRWLAERWLDRFGFEATEEWARFNNTPAPMTLRANRLRIPTQELIDRLKAHGVQVYAARYAPDAVVVESGNPLGTPLAGKGFFFIQDEASQLVSALVHARSGEIVLDACASPGGKTTALATDMDDTGLIVATDLRHRRLDLLQHTVKASGVTCVRIVQADLRASLPFFARFDAVLVDAPCSGLGTIRRDPEIRWRRNESDLGSFAAVQSTMLDRAAEVVRPGGRLVYATCSSERDENEDVIAAFLTRHPDFAPVDPRTRYRDIPPGLGAVVDAHGHLRTFPHEHGLEAFFGALLERRSGA